jgi:RND family efflux transporter MFP subunit
VEIDVNEQDLPNIKQGQIAEVSFDAFPEKTWKGTVSYIAPILSTQTHTAKVEITIDNSDKILKPGMYSKVRIKMPEKTHVFVPLNSIYRQPGTGNHYVFVLDDKKVNKKSIEKLYNLKEDVAVSGVNGGQQVVVHGKNKLKDGDQVVVKNNASQK